MRREGLRCAAYLLGNLAAQLGAVGFVGCVGVDGDDEVRELPVDERAERWQSEEDGEKTECVHVEDGRFISDVDALLRVRKKRGLMS